VVAIDSDPHRRLVAILAADGAGFSRLMSQDEPAAVAALDVARAAFRAAIEANEGRVVDMAGDSVLAVFETASAAVTAAVATQNRLASLHEALPADKRLPFRIGVHLGDVIEKVDGSVYGDGVNIAARLQALSAPGGVAVSDAVRGVVGVRLGVAFDDLGPQQFKNIAEPVHVYLHNGNVRKPTSTAPTAKGTSATVDVADVARTNLPAELPVLYGRERDVLALRPLIRSNRLVTVVCPGGVGKSSLIRALAHELRSSLEGGVWWVDLAPLADASRVAAATASVLHISLAGEDQSEALARALSKRQMLIVLDNCERLLPGVVALVSAILRSDPLVRLVATSQEPLKVVQEHVYRLESLAVPSIAGLESARQAGAVALFEARALATSASFVLEEHNVEAVIDICRHLDGLPLAIELAAARVPLLGVNGIRERLDHRFRVLTGGDRLASPRHQKLRGAMEWSYGLLTSQEQAVFRRLAVFAGTFRLDSAQQVAADERCDAWEVLDHLGALVDKSLVVADVGEIPRYRLLETSRAYALELLLSAGEEPAARQRHAKAMLQLFEKVHARYWAGAKEPWRKLYGPDLENLRNALAWSVLGDASTAVALIGAAADLAYAFSLRQEWRRWFAEIEPSDALKLAPRIEMRYWLQRSMFHLDNRNSDARQSANRAVEIARAAKDDIAEYLGSCYAALTRTSSPDEARQLLERALSLENPLWPPRILYLRTLAETQVLCEQNLMDEALAIAESSLNRATLNGLKGWVDIHKVRLGDICLTKGDAKRAEALAREALSQENQRGGVNLMHAMTTLASSLMVQNRLGEARAISADFFELSRSREWDLLYQFLDGCTLLAAKQNRPRAAARLLGYADKVNAVIGKRMPIQEFGRRLGDAEIRRRIDAPQMSALMKEGQWLTEESAIEITLADRD